MIAVIQTQNPLYPLPRRKCNIGYFEITIVDTEFKGTAVGLACKNYSTAMPGWYRGSFGCHGDDGRLYFESMLGRSGTEEFVAGDVIGCGVQFDDQCIFFTKNGQLFSWYRIRKDFIGYLYPTIGIYRRKDSILANFGATRFEFPVDELNVQLEKFISKKNAERSQKLDDFNNQMEAFFRENGEPEDGSLPAALARVQATIPAEIPIPQSISRSGAFAFVPFSKRVRNIHEKSFFEQDDFLEDPQNASHYGFTLETDDHAQIALMIAGLVESLKNLEDRSFTTAEIQDWMLYQAKELNIEVGAEPDLEQLRTTLTNSLHMMLADLCLRDLGDYWDITLGRKKGTVPRMDPQFDLFVIATLMLSNQEISTNSALMQLHLDRVQEEYQSDPTRPTLDGLDDETRRMHLLYFFAMLVQRSLDVERKRQKKLLRGAAKSENQAPQEAGWVDERGTKWRPPYMSLLDIEDCVDVLGDEDLPNDDRAVVDTIWRLIINKDCRPLFKNLKLSLPMHKLRQAAIDLVETERDYIYDYLLARPDEAERLVVALEEWLERVSSPPANDNEARETEDYIRKRLFSPAVIPLPTQENTADWVIERIEREIELVLKPEREESNARMRNWTLLAGAVAVAAAAAAGTLYYFVSTSDKPSSKSSSSNSSD